MPVAAMVCSFTECEVYAIEVAGRTWRFEWSDMFGPLFVGARGEPLRTQPNPLAVLLAMSWWVQQGKRVVDGRCVWVSPVGARRVHIGGRHWVQVSADGRLPMVAGRPVAVCRGCPRCVP